MIIIIIVFMIVNPLRLARSRVKKTILSLVMLVSYSLTVGCNQSNTSSKKTEEQGGSSAKIEVVATILPTYLFTKAVAGEAADVSIIVPPTTDVHDYQATPDNVKAIASGRVLVKNGLGLEEFLDNTIKNAQNSLTVIDTSVGIKTVGEISPVDESVEGGHNHEHGDANPHVWLDPVLVKQQVENIRDGLIKVDSGNEAIYKANAGAYLQELDKLHQEFQGNLAKTPNCTFITFHDAFPYLAQRYNLRQVAVVQIPEDQLSPTDVQKAIKAVQRYNVKAFFSEPGIDNKLLTSLAQDLNVTVRTLDPLETSNEIDPQYYLRAMRANLKTLEAGCQ